MKAVIMAGGEGSRLRPLTCDLPKPMARLCGRPVMEYILDLLEEHGVSEAAVTVRYLPDAISGHFPTNRYGKISLDFVEEDQPLGTAGSVKNACGGTHPDGVLVISGDAMCDIDLGAAMEYHRDSGADVTILAKKVADPREYGLIDTNKNGDINAFIEKPAFSQAISDLANTGIYILSQSALDLIPEGKSYDFAKHLFPLMLEKGMSLKCMEVGGYWCDIGDLESYIRCQQDMLAGRVRCRIEGKRMADGSVFAGDAPPRDCTVVGPVYLGKNITVEAGAVLDRAVVDNGCHIGRNARVSGSVLLPDCYIGDRAKLTGALICAAGTVKADAMLFECATVGAGAVVGERATIHTGIKIWNKKIIPPSTAVTEHVKVGGAARGYFGDDGITGQIGVELTPEFCARIGAAIGSLDPSARVAVGCSGHPSASVLKAALSAGIQSTGAGVMDFGENFVSLFGFSMNFSSVPLGVYVKGDNRAGLRVLTTGGLPANRETERNIEGILARGEFVRCAYDHMGDKVEMNGMGGLYRSQLIRCAPRGLTGCKARVMSHSLSVQKMLEDTLTQLGCDTSSGFVLEVSSQGDRVRIRDDAFGYISPHKILAWCAAGEMERGNDVAVPFDAPRLLEQLGRRYGQRVLRYYDCPADNSDEEARKVARYQMWSRDGLMQAMILMHMVKKAGGLAALADRFPEFDMAVRTVETGENPAGLLRGLADHTSGEITEGILLEEQEGVVLVKPFKRGSGLKIMAEAFSTEIAEELCGRVERRLREQEANRGE